MPRSAGEHISMSGKNASSGKELRRSAHEHGIKSLNQDDLTGLIRLCRKHPEQDPEGAESKGAVLTLLNGVTTSLAGRPKHAADCEK